MPKRRRRKIIETSGSCWNLKTRKVFLMENARRKEEFPVTPAGREALPDTLLSRQRKEEPETWLFSFVISSCIVRLW